uniref:Uncharacterized protein n=1 Tax=Avena sativa TaxID=4498 RepID=A0ACD5XVL0_AVESA
MAELLAAGLSRSVVVGAITKVQSVQDDDGGLGQNAKDDLVFITMELEKMQSFLDEGSAKKNLATMTWVKHTRQVAYDVEDCVENFLHLKDDRNLVSSWHRRLIPSYMAATLPPQDQAAQDLEKLKGRLQEFNNSYRRYNNGTSPVQDSAAAAEPSSSSSSRSWRPAMAVSQQLAPRTSPGDDLLLAEATRDATRWQRGVGNLTQLIISYDGEPALRVISIWGTGGHHGTTSIIAEAYNDNKICLGFTYRAWVKLTNPFSATDFVKELMTQFHASAACEKPMETNTIGMHVLAKMKATQPSELVDELERQVMEKKYLIVLEGLSSMADWHAIMTFLPDMGKGSRIVVSTPSSDMASLCVGNPYKILELKRFSTDHSIYALFDLIHVMKQTISLQPQVDGHKGKKPMGKTMYVATQASSSDDKAASNKRAAEKWIKNSLIGRGPQMSELREYLAKAYVNRPSVLSLWGIVGVGKSTLVKSLYYNEVLYGNFFDNYHWVDLSHPLNLRDFYPSLPRDFHPEEDRCLIVLDDVRSKEEWDLIQPALVYKNSKSVIIVITTDASIARYCTNNEDLVYNVKALEATESFNLVKMKVSPLVDKKDVELEELILKCGGLPKVIAATSDVLAKRTDKLIDNVRSLSHRFMHHLETNTEFRSLEGLFGFINSIMLNPPDFLKPCIFYLAIFPQGQIIRRRRLVRRWVAEGYSRESMGRVAEEIGEKLFSELLELSIFQQVPQLVDMRALDDTRMTFYQVNAFIREYIISRKIEENLVFELGGSCPLATQGKGRHLVILKNWERDLIVFQSIDFSRLRSLTVFGKWEPFIFSKTMTLLQVLDLEDASGVTDNDLEDMVKLLQRLKFLSLRGCREIYHLPNSLSDLRQLQTLDVMDTSIVNLPNNITKLKKLQYVRAGSTTLTGKVSPSRLPKLCRKRNQLVGVAVPAGVEKMTNLHTLGVVNIAASGGKIVMKELKKLTQLRKLGVSGINKHNTKEFLSVIISAQGHLESLSVRLDKDSKGSFDDISLPWDKLHSLKLYGLGDKLPLLRNKLAKIRKLDLEMNSLIETDVQFLGELSNLCILRLGVKQPSLRFYAELNGNQIKSYEKVKILEIACSNSSLHVTFGSKAMKNLEVLNLDCSSGSSSYLLSGLNYQSDLKEVVLMGTNDEAIKLALQKQLLKHPKKPVVKLLEATRSS